MSTLPVNHQELLQSYKEHLDNVRSCIEQNYNVIKLILKDVETLFENINPEENNPRTVRTEYHSGLHSDAVLCSK